MVVLEIGPGTIDGHSKVFPGAETIDLINRTHSKTATWGLTKLPHENKKFDLVYASHVLEHVQWYRIDAALAEVLRILKPGGEFEVYVPDFGYIVECYHQERCGDNWRVFNPDSDFMTWVNGRIFTYGEDATELLSAERPIKQTHHKTVFDQDYLIRKLMLAGFDVVMQKQRRNGRSHSIPEVGAVATKPF